MSYNDRVFAKAGNSLIVQPGTNAHLKIWFLCLRGVCRALNFVLWQRPLAVLNVSPIEVRNTFDSYRHV